MLRRLLSIFLLVLAGGVIHAQEIKRMAIQSNLLSLARPYMPAANIGVMVEKGMKFYTVEMDLGFHVYDRISMPSEMRLNGFTMENRYGVNPDLSGGIHWYFSDKKRSFHGLRANLGYFAFNHQQSICDDLVDRGSYCLCESFTDYTFTSAHIRFGLNYRLGLIRQFNEKHAIELSFDVGIFALLRLNSNLYNELNMCESIMVKDRIALDYLVDTYQNRMFNFDRYAQGFVRLNLVYRFSL